MWASEKSPRRRSGGYWMKCASPGSIALSLPYRWSVCVGESQSRAVSPPWAWTRTCFVSERRPLESWAWRPFSLSLPTELPLFALGRSASPDGHPRLPAIPAWSSHWKSSRCVKIGWYDRHPSVRRPLRRRCRSARAGRRIRRW